VKGNGWLLLSALLSETNFNEEERIIIDTPGE